MPPELPTIARPATTTTQEQSLLDRVLASTGQFDAEMWHVMDRRDDQLVRDEALQGVTSDTFVYEFKIQGKEVSGISVRGAAHLAHLYGGIKHRLIASVDKRGNLFTFKTYPAPGQPMSVTVQRIPELAGDDDYFEVVVEVEDVKNGNSIQVTKKQMAVGHGQNGTYQIQHHEILAESKAFRNAVLRVVSQDVVNDFKMRALKAKHGADVTSDTIDAKRTGILQYAAKHALSIDRERVNALVYAQIAGLAEAARQGIEQFKASAAALGLVAGEAQAAAASQADASEETATSPPPPPTAPEQQARGRGRPRKDQQAQGDQRPEPPAQGEPAQQTTGQKPAQAVDGAQRSPGPGVIAGPQQQPAQQQSLLPPAETTAGPAPSRTPPQPPAAPPAQQQGGAGQDFLDGFQ